MPAQLVVAGNGMVGQRLVESLRSRDTGHVVSRTSLLAAPAGDGGEHALEVAAGRLRGTLGDPRAVQTVVKRGYRLAYEPEQAAGCGVSRRYCTACWQEPEGDSA